MDGSKCWRWAFGKRHETLVMYQLIGIGAFGGIGSVKNVRNFRPDYFTVLVMKMIVTSIQLNSQIN